MDKVDLAPPRWTAWDKSKHKRGPLPQCSKPGCRVEPVETRYSQKMRAGAIVTQRHAFCETHAEEERDKQVPVPA